MGSDCLDELVANTQQGVKAGQWILKDRANLPPAHPSDFLRCEIVDATTRQLDGPAGDSTGRFKEPDHGVTRHRLSGPRLANDAEDFADPNRE